MDPSGNLTVGQRLERIEHKVDGLSSRLEVYAGRAEVVELDQRVRAIEKIADRYVPDPAEMLQRRQQWERMQRGLERLDAVDQFKRWLWPALVGGFCGVGALVVAVLALVLRR